MGNLRLDYECQGGCGRVERKASKGVRTRSACPDCGAVTEWVRVDQPGASAEHEPVTDGGRPSGKTRELPTGDTVYEADDCRFVASPSNTLHERDEWPGEIHDYAYHPRCGQRLPADSMWSRVDADTVEEAVTEYDLAPCGNCFDNAYRLRTLRREAREERRELATDGGQITPATPGDTAPETLPDPRFVDRFTHGVDVLYAETDDLGVRLYRVTGRTRVVRALVLADAVIVDGTLCRTVTYQPDSHTVGCYHHRAGRTAALRADRVLDDPVVLLAEVPRDG